VARYKRKYKKELRYCKIIKYFNTNARVYSCRNKWVNNPQIWKLQENLNWSWNMKQMRQKIFDTRRKDGETTAGAICILVPKALKKRKVTVFAILAIQS
jgi:hypothetical protein